MKILLDIRERLARIEVAKAALEKREREDNPDKPIDPKKQISFADHDARCYSKKSEGTEYIHNAQAAVDMESQIIVENHIEDSTADAHATEATLGNIKQDLGVLPEKLVADAGYGNQDTLRTCQDQQVVPICATTREGSDGGRGKLDGFAYEREQDRFVCLHGQIFEFDHALDKDGKRVYRSQLVMSCRCSDYVNRDGRGVIAVLPGHFAKRELRRIMDEPGNRDIYRRRKCTVEPVFGQIQVGMGCRRFFYRGKKNVGAEWNLVCAALNIKKMAARIGQTGGWTALMSQTRDYVRLLARLFSPVAIHDAAMPQPV